MSDFVKDKLKEWNLQGLIPQFEAEEITEESFLILEEKDIDKLIDKVGPRRIFIMKHKEFCQSQAEPSTSACRTPPATKKGRKRSAHANKTAENEKAKKKSRTGENHHDTVLATSEEAKMLTEVKEIMKNVCGKLDKETDTELNAFLKGEIKDLETPRKETVGVFGKTGAGKSFLINAIIGAKNLLPSGKVTACTSVVTKVEANEGSSDYVAEIEFISKKEWDDELWSLLMISIDGKCDDGGKISALYREGIQRSYEELKQDKHFKSLPEFLSSTKKELRCATASQLSAQLVKFTKHDKSGRQYWPLVKCVTIKAPRVHDLLEYVTLMDLPGTGDCNPHRNRMWKEYVGSCSTVWIVTEINRAASEKEAWDIFEDTINLIGNGGECQRIIFICTKSDDSGKGCRLVAVMSQPTTTGGATAETTPTQTDRSPHHGHKARNRTPSHPGQDSPQDGTPCRQANKPEVCRILEQIKEAEVDKIRRSIDEAYKAFETRIEEGVEKSLQSYEKDMRKTILDSKGKKDQGFHKKLRSLVVNGGIYKPADKEKRTIDINEILASHLRESIDKKFMETFPNDRSRGPFNGAISKFTLGTERLAEKYTDVSLHLTFLRSEEEKLKMQLRDEITERKKEIYNTLQESIKETMQPCYQDAAKETGTGSLQRMRDKIEKHLQDSKSTMFNKAKDDMLHKMRDLREWILGTVNYKMENAIKLSLKTGDDSLPDVSEEYDKVKKYYEELRARETCSQQSIQQVPEP
ncbi:nuclear GTPase SLIP-GC-like [Myripristis murdjan]|uniref:nuclear GTPase SLIP-GC-like n=1 Tax=Myripristis murdjan TaxID=586833 RepID=UPI001175D137|nr:nuclear GTPase SLIP-GC-like [Myripristis murdjan]